LACRERAIQLAEATGADNTLVWALVGLAEGQRFQGDPDRARASASRALALARRAGYRVLEARANTALAAALRDQEDLALAARHARRGLAIDRDMGSRIGEARTLAILGDVLCRSSQDDEGIARLREALALFDNIGAAEAGAIRARLAAEEEP